MVEALPWSRERLARGIGVCCRWCCGSPCCLVAGALPGHVVWDIVCLVALAMALSATEHGSRWHTWQLRCRFKGPIPATRPQAGLGFSRRSLHGAGPVKVRWVRKNANKAPTLMAGMLMMLSQSPTSWLLST
jgi:hypothetical protein